MKQIRAINKKDIKGWEYLYSTYYQSLCSYAYTLVKDVHFVEDQVQEVFVKLWDGAASFDSEEQLKAYLYKSIHNNCLSSVRVETNRAKLIERYGEELSNESLMSIIIREDILRELYGVIEELPTERRRVLVMLLRGYSIAEVADELGVSVNTIKTQRLRSIHFLREKLSKEEFTLLVLILFM